ncbi:unnamed protein product [Cladocopium goreaui]|uniref:Plastoquinol--plastocyanin reductase n=1 Tax=Cladocopium goreaui TaxID=2562237 RepID=A0A9P1D9Z3_9DINO|nr:unnamed protein product [Cladocopium goreaui]
MGCNDKKDPMAQVEATPLVKWSYIHTKSSMSMLPMRTCGCFQGLWSYFSQDCDNEEERRRFETTVAFLRSVPLFRRQLPSCELPKLARDLKVKSWRPGERLVRQEEVGRAFYLIQSGRASVIVTDFEGKEHVRATLIAGDYFGGHTLVAERVNNCSVVADGPEMLVTLSMSRKDKLFFPKRPALTVDRGPSRDPSWQTMSAVEKTPQEQAFLLTALKNNVNLRALHDVSNQVMHSIAAGAVPMIVPKGSVVAQSGDVGQEFFVIKRGTFHAFADCGRDESRSPKSAEATVAQLTISERLKRKQNFLKSLSCRKGHQPNSRLHSQSVRLASAPKGPKAMSEWADDFNPFKGPGWVSPRSEDWRTPCSTVASKADFMQMASFQVGDRVRMQPEKVVVHEDVGGLDRVQQVLGARGECRVLSQAQHQAKAQADAELKQAKTEQRNGLMSGKRAADVCMALLELRGRSGSERQRAKFSMEALNLVKDAQGWSADGLRKSQADATAAADGADDAGEDLGG